MLALHLRLSIQPPFKFLSTINEYEPYQTAHALIVKTREPSVVLRANLNFCPCVSTDLVPSFNQFAPFSLHEQDRNKEQDVLAIAPKKQYANSRAPFPLAGSSFLVTNTGRIQMAIYTPRGLKVRLATPFAFALIARVFPKFDAFRILQLTEEVENLPALASFLAAVVAYAFRSSPFQVATVVFVTLMLFRFIHLFGLFVPPFTALLPLARVYSLLSGYGILLVCLLVFGYVRTGWAGALAFLAARIAGGIVFSAVEWAWSKRAYRLLGFPFTASERSFFHAFRLAAVRAGVSTTLNAEEDELVASNWYPVLLDLKIKWPTVAQRITDD